MAHTLVLANSGAVVPTTGAPDYGGGATDFALLCLALAALDACVKNVAPQHLTAAGAVSIKPGNVFLNTGTAGAFTLALPTAGSVASGGNDGQEMAFFAEDAEAYTLTTPTSGYNDAHHIATFGGAAGDSITVVAYNGFWWVKSLNAVVIS